MARWPTGSVTNTAAWEYWDGERWQSDEDDAAPLVDTAGNPLNGVVAGIKRLGDGRIVMAALSDTFTRSFAFYVTRWGPTGGRVGWTLYDSKILAPGEAPYGGLKIAYGQSFVPEAAKTVPEGKMLLAFCVNQFGASNPPGTNMHEEDSGLYQPRYIVLDEPAKVLG
jgi:hypothetical protein